VYGGAVPNPLTILAELFAELHDKNFHVTVPGFYDRVAKLSNTERKALNALPWNKKAFQTAVSAPAVLRRKGIFDCGAALDAADARIERNMGGTRVKGAKTVIPSKAYAKFSTRLRAESRSEEDCGASEEAHSQIAALKP